MSAFALKPHPQNLLSTRGAQTLSNPSISNFSSTKRYTSNDDDKSSNIAVAKANNNSIKYHLTCVDRDLPVACVVGGGYSKDNREVGQRHALLHRVCAKVWRDLEMWKRAKSVTPIA